MFIPDFKDKLDFQNPHYKDCFNKFFEFWVYSDALNIDLSSKLVDESSLYVLSVKAKQDFALAGMSEVLYLLNRKNLVIEFSLKDGEHVSHGQNILVVCGKLTDLLPLERFILNFLSRMCSVATRSLVFLQKMKQFDNKVGLACTRKGILSVLDKRAASVAGVISHRVNLGHGIMIKDNHRNFLKSDFINNISTLNFDFVEFEFDNINEYLNFKPILEKLSVKYNTGILLDNFTIEDLKVILDEIPNLNNRNYFVEVSGGINYENIDLYDLPNLDFVSTSDIFYEKAVDLSAEVVKK
jgi:nicotinate-nucleotide pyrophosphorylase (carboxylating)